MCTATFWLTAALVLFVAGAKPVSARVRASILVDAQTGRILEASNPDSLCYPASLTKLMTLYLTFQHLREGKLTLEQELPVSPHAAEQLPTKLYLHPGDTISVRSAILGITTRSANDAAVVLAEAISGSETKFAELMNEKARELGMTHTTFRNASGLPNPYQKTTARDMSKLALAILDDYPNYYRFFSATSFRFRGRTIYGHDRLLARYPGVDGMKTGFTDASGFNIVTSAVRYGRRLVGVVMGGKTAASRDRQMISLLNRGFALEQAERLTFAAAKTPTGAEAVREPIANSATARTEDIPSESQWVIQVGGTFRSAYRVKRVLRSAMNSAPAALKDATPIVVKLRHGRYCARFTDVGRDHAVQACSALRSLKFTCIAYEEPAAGRNIASQTE
ncbi:MAG TPA: D-alanyl-D-alanine carboxypeptidase family protein [Terriglobia bacterium]|nr:D-alanyl-D-alanine carboxypeptidase family protein [Terriglobia bacterium]